MKIRPITTIGLLLSLTAMMFVPNPIAIVIGVLAIIVALIGLFTAEAKDE